MGAEYSDCSYDDPADKIGDRGQCLKLYSKYKLHIGRYR